MSDSTLARRTEIAVKIGGVDVSTDMNKYLIQMTYTDNEEDKTDDLQLSLDDREGTWLSWFGGGVSNSDATIATESGELKAGDTVEFKGGSHYYSSDAATPTGGKRTAGPAKLTKISRGAKHPYHVIGISGKSNVYGWVDEGQISGAGGYTPAAAQEQAQESGGGIKGADISAVIIQRNWDSDGKDRVLECGLFEIDSMDASGPPAGVSIKATSLPYSSTVRKEKKTKAWEKIKLSAIAAEIAQKNGMKCMFLSAYDPTYTRREQVQISDIVFLQGLCKDAGISLKVSANIIVLFDEADFEKKAAVREIRRGASDILSYRFGTSMNDTKYAKCHVSYTDPQTKKTIEYTYIPKMDNASIGTSFKVTSTSCYLRSSAATLKNNKIVKIPVGATLTTSGVKNNWIKCVYGGRTGWVPIGKLKKVERGEDNEQTLEINEKVTNKEEAKQLAMKRLRQKNKAEFAAEFTLVGDVRIVAGVTVTVIGWGVFDAKYIVETATHDVTGSGYTLQVKLRRVLEDY